MNINFYDVIKFEELKGSIYTQKIAPTSINFVLSYDSIHLPNHLSSNDLLIITLDELALTMDDINTLQSASCAGIIIFAAKIRSLPSFLNCMPVNLVITKHIENMRQLIKKITLIISADTIDQNMIKGVVDSILFKSENYALYDWLYLLNMMNVNIFSSYQVALIKIDIEDCQTELYNKTISLLEAEYDVKLYSIWQNILVCIVDEYSNNQGTFEVMQHIRSSFHADIQPYVKISLGNAYQGLEYMQNSFREAIRAFDMISIIDPSHNICSYKMLGIYSILYELNNPDVFNKYCDDLFAPIRKYDHETQSHLFSTLEAYFANECDLDITSNQLRIHRNTLRYRIKKIEELLNMNLQNINDITEIVTAFKIRRLIKIL